jgi:hypothetical protein
MEMRIPASWVIAGALAIGLTSCAGEETATTPDPTASPSAAGTTASSSPSTDPKAQTFPQPLVPGKGKEGESADGKVGKDKDGKDKRIASASLNAIPGLTKSTDPDEQANKVQAQINSAKANRSDPFNSLPPLVTFKTPKVQSSIPLTATGDVGRSRSDSSDKIAAMPEMPKFPEVIKPSPRSRSRVASRPLNTPNRTPGVPGIPSMPPIPQPTLAREVEVTGVVTIGNSTQAIVKAPNEPTSRYVSVGQRLAGGQVLVKRIEMNPGSDPIVVLEENGIEVPIAVGTKKTPKP